MHFKDTQVIFALFYEPFKDVVLVQETWDKIHCKRVHYFNQEANYSEFCDISMYTSQKAQTWSRPRCHQWRLLSKQLWGLGHGRLPGTAVRFSALGIWTLALECPYCSEFPFRCVQILFSSFVYFLWVEWRKDCLWFDSGARQGTCLN